MLAIVAAVCCAKWRLHSLRPCDLCFCFSCFCCSYRAIRMWNCSSLPPSASQTSSGMKRTVRDRPHEWKVEYRTGARGQRAVRKEPSIWSQPVIVQCWKFRHNFHFVRPSVHALVSSNLLRLQRSVQHRAGRKHHIHNAEGSAHKDCFSTTMWIQL